MPSMAGLREFYESHTKEEYDSRLREIKPVIDDTTDEAFCSIFETSLENWADTRSPIPIDDVSVEVLTDDLMMNEHANKKMYENLFVHANVYYDSKQITGDEAKIVEQIYDGVMDAPRETPYGAYKIYEITIIRGGVY